MSLYSEDPEFKKAFDAYGKDVFEYVKKKLEEYMAEYTATWVAEELKKMGYLEKEK